MLPIPTALKLRARGCSSPGPNRARLALVLPWHLGLLCASVLLVVGCTTEVPVSEPVNFEFRWDGDARLHLSTTPTALALAKMGETLPDPVPIPTAISDSLLHLSDVGSLPGGALILADRMANRIFVTDPEITSIERRIGRPGEGPGDFRGLMGVTTLEDGVVALDLDPTQAFTLFDFDGTVRTTWPLPPGDLYGAVWRVPDIGLEKPYQHGPEDWTRRLSVWQGSGFAYLHQADERRYIAGITRESPGAAVLRLDSTFAAPDTIWAGPAPRLRDSGYEVTTRSGEPVTGAAPRPMQGIGRQRLLIAGGNDWGALFLPGSGEIRVTRAGEGDEGPQGLTIVWDQIPPVVTNEMKRETARLYAKYNDRRVSGKRPGREPASDRVARIADRITPWFDLELTPVAALYGSGACLWILGANPGDSIDATGHTLLGINLAQLSGEPVLYRLVQPEARIRHISETHIITSTRSDFNEIQLFISPLPEPGC